MYEFDSERVQLVKIFDRLGLTGVGVEVGVLTGFFSELILKHSHLRLLISVDYWFREEELVESYRRLALYSDRSCLVRADSITASGLFPDGFFDFIYVDADHRYESVKKDIDSCWPKLRNGGFFSGHDYMPTNPWHNGALWGVIEAVNEFAAREEQEVHLVGDYPSWYIIKNQRIKVL